MGFLGFTPAAQQRLAVFIPLVALVISLYVVYGRWIPYQQLNGQLQAQRAEYARLQAEAVPTPSPVVTAVADAPSEPAQFLGQMTILARDSKCRIAGFDVAKTGPRGAPAQPGASGPSGGAAPANSLIRPVRATVTLDARYSQVRDFLYRLAHAPRLYVVTDCQLTAPKSAPANASPLQPQRLQATVEIERYVTNRGQGGAA